MRLARFLAPPAIVILASTPASAAGDGVASSPTVVTATSVRAFAPGPRSRAVSIPAEILSPVGGAGCFYQRRPLAGVLVIAGSLIAGGALIWAASHGDRDATILDAVAYGVVRGAGIFVAAQPTAGVPARSPSDPPPAGPHASGPAAPLRSGVGFWPRFSF
jgi:hypothetical protein